MRVCSDADVCECLWFHHCVGLLAKSPAVEIFFCFFFFFYSVMG